MRNNILDEDKLNNEVNGLEQQIQNEKQTDD